MLIDSININIPRDINILLDLINFFISQFTNILSPLNHFDYTYILKLKSYINIILTLNKA